MDVQLLLTTSGTRGVRAVVEVLPGGHVGRELARPVRAIVGAVGRRVRQRGVEDNGESHAEDCTGWHRIRIPLVEEEFNFVERFWLDHRGDNLKFVTWER